MGEVIEFPLHRRITSKIIKRSDSPILDIHIGETSLAQKILHPNKFTQSAPQLKENVYEN